MPKVSCTTHHLIQSFVHFSLVGSEDILEEEPGFVEKLVTQIIKNIRVWLFILSLWIFTCIGYSTYLHLYSLDLLDHSYKYSHLLRGSGKAWII